MTRKTKKSFPAEIVVKADKDDPAYLLAVDLGDVDEIVDMGEIVKLARYQLVSTFSVEGKVVAVGDEKAVKPVKA